MPRISPSQNTIRSTLVAGDLDYFWARDFEKIGGTQIRELKMGSGVRLSQNHGFVKELCRHSCSRRECGIA